MTIDPQSLNKHARNRTVLGMKHLPMTIAAVLLCTGCPDIINYYPVAEESGGGESGSTGEPIADMPTEMDTGETGDGDGDGDTGSGDGDGDPGDGDGDGEPDPTDGDLGALIVTSAGVRIGYLLDVWDYGYVVWDDINEIQYHINDQTGNVAEELWPDPGLYMFTVTPDCTGPRYVDSPYETAQDCNGLAPMVRPIYTVDGSKTGLTPAASLETTSGVSVVIMPQGLLHPNGQCFSHVSPHCAFAVLPTDVIPVTFDLPIEVAQVFAP